MKARFIDHAQDLGREISFFVDGFGAAESELGTLGEAHRDDERSREARTEAVGWGSRHQSL